MKLNLAAVIIALVLPLHGCASAVKPIGRIIVAAGNEVCMMIQQDSKSGLADEVCAGWDELSPFFKDILKARKSRAAARASASVSAQAQ